MEYDEYEAEDYGLTNTPFGFQMVPYQAKDINAGRWNTRRFAPWYDDQADYNTNAKSYYDYLARRNKYLKYLTDAINYLESRQLSVAETATTKMSRANDWYKQNPLTGDNSNNEVTITTDVKLSDKTDPKPNAIIVDGNKGLYAKDFTSDIDGIKNDIKNIDSKVNNLSKSIFSPDNPYTIKGKMINGWAFNGGPDPDFSIHYGLVDDRGGNDYNWVRWTFGFNWASGPYGDGNWGTIDLTGTPLDGKVIAGGSGSWLYSGNVIHFNGNNSIPMFRLKQDGNIITVTCIGVVGATPNSNEIISINNGGAVQSYNRI